jgi:hypothetical protein
VARELSSVSTPICEDVHFHATPGGPWRWQVGETYWQYPAIRGGALLEVSQDGEHWVTVCHLGCVERAFAYSLGYEAALREAEAQRQKQ